MILKEKKAKKKPWAGKISFRCFKEEEEAVKEYAEDFDFNEWFRDSLKEALRRAKAKKGY